MARLAPHSSRYFEKLDVIADELYIPSVDDVLLSRTRTTGIVRTELMIDNAEFHIFDCGGARNERRKWIHAFHNVTAVIFVAALSEYDQVGLVRQARISASV